MDICLTPTKLSGSVTVPPCKNMQHYELVAAALAGENICPEEEMSEDIRATCCGVKTLLTDRGKTEISCCSSGTTLRLLLPLAMARGGADFVCSEELCARPLPSYASCEVKNGHIVPKNRLTSGIFPMPGDQSSLFIIGLFYALPLLDGDSTITFTTPFEEDSEIRMALTILRAHGIEINLAYNSFVIPGRQKYRPCKLALERDWAAASYFSVLNCLGSKVELLNMTRPSLQSEGKIEELCRNLPEAVDVYDIPDLVPSLALYASLLPNRMTVLYHAGQMRLTENDRLHSVSDTLRDLGATVIYTGESLFVFGRDILTGGTVSSRGDQRIAMMAAAAATCCTGKVTIRGAECVNRIYPRFFEDLKTLGMKIEVV